MNRVRVVTQIAAVDAAARELQTAAIALQLELPHELKPLADPLVTASFADGVHGTGGNGLAWTRPLEEIIQALAGDG